ncbi:hypothetical protein BDY17DRAFT_325397 [Neohortaea acidophila]|uniref:F-box domain-containing protein n=1 Tax=Neohortaea acidophila TaxID=245834 RepID=A0A6A6PP82_9PEZI|nr:uncharacterized protein BDY17DRAFT_325397 [Neohortaea acidophila]KAF2481889.1 hypothetical protein BDY17DRAFT_325397 [Neohortaea acidophila]
MLSLPTEIHTSILQTATFPDLCSLRQTCKALHRLLSHGDILRHWLHAHLAPHQLALFPLPSTPTFTYAVEQQRRHDAATETAALLSEFIEREVLRVTLKRLDVYPQHSRAELSVLVKAQLKEKLVPLLLTVQHYLEKFAEAVLRCVGNEQGSENFDTLYDELRAAESRILDSYSPEQLLQTHKFWLFFCWLHNYILDRPDYECTRGRPLAYGVGESDRRYQFRLMLVLGNLSALRTLLKAETDVERFELITSWTRRLDPELNSLWRRQWEAVVFGCRQPLAARQAKAALRLTLSVGEVWVDGATAALVSRGLLRVDKNRDVGSPWQALDFLFDVAGYDVLQTPPSLMQELRWHR